MNTNTKKWRGPDNRADVIPIHTNTLTENLLITTSLQLTNEESIYKENIILQDISHVVKIPHHRQQQTYHTQQLVKTGSLYRPSNRVQLQLKTSRS